jgi:hypothetical protein
MANSTKIIGRHFEEVKEFKEILMKMEETILEKCNKATIQDMVAKNDAKFLLRD